jgi:hypothetical protein
MALRLNLFVVVQLKHQNDSEQLLEEPAGADHLSLCSIGQTAGRLEPFGQQAAPDRRPLMKKIFLAVALVLTFAATAAAPAMAEQFPNPFSQR